ncbi:hypothetical protein AMECASPLE_010238 [Ameca splendens]|uniref:Uncharacterized protein n=1 Tax=Ameca splendens TaxID=208324 RepID=A0ABV0XPR7_9TELE
MFRYGRKVRKKVMNTSRTCRTRRRKLDFETPEKKGGDVGIIQRTELGTPERDGLQCVMTRLSNESAQMTAKSVVIGVSAARCV